MIYAESLSTDPYWNLAFEEFLFEKLPSEEVFYLWQNSNTVVVGKYQNTAEEINHSYASEQGIRVVRRLSGGGAVYHDEGNLNYSFIVKQPDDAEIFDFHRFSEPLLTVLNGYGLKAECSGRNDILLDRKKICGNAQYLKNGRLLHHGCILLESDISRMTAALNVRAAKFQSKGDPSVRSRVTTINSCLEQKISIEVLKKDLKSAVFDSADTIPYQLTEAARKEINRLRDEKYSSWEWNFGNDEEYEMRREQKFPAGLVTVSLKAEKSRIIKIAFRGDFFGNGDIGELEQQLEGARLDDSLVQKLKPANKSQELFSRFLFFS